MFARGVQVCVKEVMAKYDVAGVTRTSWNLGLLYEQQGELARAEPLIAHAAAFMAQIGHAQHAKLTADKLAEVRQKLAEQGG
jgi:hypothetical protein